MEHVILLADRQGFSAFYTTKAPEQSDVNKVLNGLVETHPNPVMIDTSNIYTLQPGNGDNERAIGAWLADHPGVRSKVFLATKFAITPTFGIDTTREAALRECDASLKRLGVDSVDLYYVHRPNRATGIPGIEDTFRGLKELKEQGKTRYIGCSEYNLEELKAANAIAHVDAYQIELSPWTPQILENGLADWCNKNGTAIVAYSPLGRGALAGRFKSPDDIPEGDFRKANDRYTPENFKLNMAIVDDLKKIAEKRGATASQITLAWVMAQGAHVFPIPGTTNLERLKENAGAAQIKLTAEEKKEIDDLVKAFKPAGERYSKASSAGTAF